MSQLDDFIDALGAEARTEMAQNFFGNRKRIEDEVELLHKSARRAKKRLDVALSRAALLHLLLLDEPAGNADSWLNAFYNDVLDVSPESLRGLTDLTRPDFFCSPPFALTAKGRWKKLMAKVYAHLQDEIDAYLHGRWENDPSHRGKKRLTANYEFIAEWHKDLNQRIKKLNEQQSPSAVLCFNRSMDPETLDRERHTGATLQNYCQMADESLAMPQVPWEELNIEHLPDLPPPDQVRKPLRKFAARLYAANRQRCRGLLRQIKSSSR